MRYITKQNPQSMATPLYIINSFAIVYHQADRLVYNQCHALYIIKPIGLYIIIALSMYKMRAIASYHVSKANYHLP